MEKRLNYDEVRHEAKAAATTGRTLEESCRWPWSSPEGRLFTEMFVMHRAALTALGMNDKPLTPN